MAATAVITGASGLIGRRVLEHWDILDLEPIALASTDIDLLSADAATHVVERYKPHVIVHLAWSASGTPGYRTSVLNKAWVAASLRLHEAARGARVRFLAAGTVVDDRPGVDPYSQSKSELRTALDVEIVAGAIAWVRPFYVFDPVLGRPAVVGLAMAAAASGFPVSLQSPGSTHDFVHASDVGRAIVAAISHDLTGSIEVGSGVQHSVVQLVEACGATWEADGQLVEAVTHSDQSADIGALTATGWSPLATEQFFPGGR